MIYVKWKYKELIQYELLSPNQTINFEKYSFQIAVLEAKIKQKWLEITKLQNSRVQHDNGWPHITMNVRQLFIECGCDVLCIFYRIHQIWLPQIFIFSVHFRILWMTKSLFLWSLSNSILIISLQLILFTFKGREFCNCQNDNKKWNLS